MVELDAQIFQRRIATLVSAWQSGDSGDWNKADSLLVAVGSSDEESNYQKSTALEVCIYGLA